MMNSNQRDKVLGELGVHWVTYELVCAGWDVYRKINEKGFDLIAERNNKRILIEVKTRDPLKSTGKNRNYITVGGSNAQREAAQYLAVYLHGFAKVIMIPVSHPLVAAINSTNGLRVATLKNEKLEVREEFLKYVNNFELR